MERFWGLRLAAAVGLCAAGATADVYDYAGFSWDQDRTPDVMMALGNGQTIGGTTFSAGIPNDTTASVGFNAVSGSSGAGFVGEAGFDPTRSIGRQAFAQIGASQSGGGDALFVNALNLPDGNNGGTTRHGIRMSWSGGRSLINGAGADFVLYESGSNSTSPEAQMVRAMLSDGSFTPWYYRAVDAWETYTQTPSPTVEGAFATAYDLLDLGVGLGDVVVAIEIANMKPTDRLNVAGAFAAAGEVVFSDPSGTLARPSIGSINGMNPSSTFGSGAFDPDPVYLGIMGTLTPAPGVLGLGCVSLLAAARRRRS